MYGCIYRDTHAHVPKRRLLELCGAAWKWDWGGVRWGGLRWW